GLAVLVWQAGRRRGWPARIAATAGLLYALNPVAILTSAFHGNQTVLSVFFAFAGYYYVAADPRGGRWGYPPGALLLGLGIAARSFPVLLLPVFLILLPVARGPAGWRQRALFAGWALLPAALVSVPALLLDAPAYLRETLAYSGFADQGWLAIRRAWGVVQGSGSPFPPDTAAWLAFSKWLFLAGYAALLGWLIGHRRRVSLARASLLVWLLFYLVYGGVSTHYLGWVIPFGLLVAWRPTALYSLAAAAAMIGFYLTWFPPILLGRYAPPVHWTGLEWHGYLITLILAWGVNAIWFVCALRRPGAILDFGFMNCRG
ncbi:MAG TPA: hypothetical protein VKY74_20235, partial [Chloroflexia bacterium]|nr:hypothetical protein [Chloroflexia bacterium]